MTARTELLSLFWSEGAQRLITAYGYVGIRLLAERMGIELDLAQLASPPIDPDGEVRFASFLSQHASWTTDQELQSWLRLLDGKRRSLENQREAFHEYLGAGEPFTGSLTADDRFSGLAVGMHQFLVRLSDVFGVLGRHERPRFGLFYAYWMGRYFGYDLNEQGYVRDGFDWSSVIDGLLLGPGQIDEEAELAYKQMLQGAVTTIRSTWAATNALLTVLQFPRVDPARDEPELPQQVAAPPLLPDRLDSARRIAAISPGQAAIQPLDIQLPHTLDEDFLNKRPYEFALHGQLHKGINSWQQLYKVAYHQLAWRYPERMALLQGQQPADRVDETTRLALRRLPVHRPPNLEYWLSPSTRSANGIRDLLKRLLRTLDIDPQELVIYLSADRAPGPNA